MRDTIRNKIKLFFAFLIILFLLPYIISVFINGKNAVQGMTGKAVRRRADVGICPYGRLQCDSSALPGISSIRGDSSFGSPNRGAGKP